MAVGPAASQASLQALQAVIEAHGQDDMPTAHTVRLDNTHVFSLSMRPILDAAGRQVGLLTFASDITREEKAFRRDAMVIGLVGLALAGLVTFLLYALTRRVNWQAAELVRAQGRTLKELDAAVRQRTAALEQEVEQRRSSDVSVPIQDGCKPGDADFPSCPDCGSALDGPEAPYGEGEPPWPVECGCGSEFGVG